MQIDPSKQNTRVYASVQEMIQLPPKHKISDKHKIFPPITKTVKGSDFELSEPILDKTNQLLKELNTTFDVFDSPKSFKFTFPDSMFPAVAEGEYNQIRYEQKIITEQENTFKNRLSEEQLKQIAEKGEFKVRSNIQYITLPYVWQINRTIFNGSERNNLYFRQVLAAIFGFAWEAKQAIVYEIPKQLMLISSIPYSVFKLLFGKRSVQTVVSVNYERQIYKDFWHKILKEYYSDCDEWFSAIWNYLYVYYDPELHRPIELTKDPQTDKKLNEERNRLKQKYEDAKQQANQRERTIMSVEEDFNRQWAKLKKKVVLQITQELAGGLNTSLEGRPESQEELLNNNHKENDQKEQEERILERLAEKKFSLYTQHLRKTLPEKGVPLDVVNAIILLLRLFSFIIVQQTKLQVDTRAHRQEIKQKLKKQYPIKSMYYRFLTIEIDKEFIPLQKSMQNQLYNSLLTNKEFTAFLNENQIEAYRQFLKMRANKEMLIQAKKKQLPQYHGPTRIFYSNYKLLPPYKVIKHGQYYDLQKVSDDLTVDTSQNFWKVRLYWMRLKTWTINCVVFLAKSVWKGPIGIRCLYGIQDFNSQMMINYQTGQILYSTERTVLGSFKKVLEGIKKSRNAFEEAPDLGLLGKNVSRVFNYIECYIFRFLFVGVLVALIGFPLLILVASSVTVVLVLTFWAWMPVMLLATYLFNIFIKQFETAIVQYGFWARSFPLLRIVLRLITAILLIIWSFFRLLVLVPVCSFFYFLFCGAINLIRRLIDFIMMLIFRHLGRTPSRDTLIAKKISGPGMSKEFYMSINEEDVYILTRANLQLQFLNKFNELIVEKIEKQSHCFSSTVQRILEPFGAYYNKGNPVIENKNVLLSNYRNQYNIHRNRYPCNPSNVRFTQQEIDNYFPNTVSIVRSFVEKQELQGWIFEQYQLYQDMYDELTRHVWMEIFNCGQEIFQPLEKLDTRFKLEDQYKNDVTFNTKMKKGVGSVMQALEGEVYFNHHNKRLAPFKHNLLSRQKQIQTLGPIFASWGHNSKGYVDLQTRYLCSLFVPNLNIDQIKIVDQETRMRNIKQQEHIVDI